MKKILITGGGGFLGTHLIEKFLTQEKDNVQIVVVDNGKSIGGIFFRHPKVEFLLDDICKPELYDKLSHYAFDAIYHLAAQSAGESSYDNPQYDLLTNSYGTYLMANFAKKQKVRRFIYTSTVAVYGNSASGLTEETAAIKPDSIYGVSKYSGELFVRQILEKSECATSIFRVFNTFGPGENLNYMKKGMVSIYASYIWRNQPILVKGSLDRYRDYTYIDDCIEALYKAYDNENSFGETYNLSSGVKTSVRDLLALMVRTAKKPEDYPIQELPSTPGDSFGFHASIKKLESDLNWEPKISLEEGLIKYFEWIFSIPVCDDLSPYHPLNSR